MKVTNLFETLINHCCVKLHHSMTRKDRPCLCIQRCSIAREVTTIHWRQTVMVRGIPKHSVTGEDEENTRGFPSLFHVYSWTMPSPPSPLSRSATSQEVTHASHAGRRGSLATSHCGFPAARSRGHWRS